MQETYTHTCPCGKQYKDNDPDVYFCAECVEERKAIARKIDAQMANRPKPVPKSDYQILQERGQSRGQATFVRASDLGLNFGA